jgi:hypothetical protein
LKVTAAKPGLGVRLCGSAVFLVSLNNHITDLRNNDSNNYDVDYVDNKNVPLFCYIVKHLFYISAV